MVHFLRTLVLRTDDTVRLQRSHFLRQFTNATQLLHILPGTTPLLLCLQAWGSSFCPQRRPIPLTSKAQDVASKKPISVSSCYALRELLTICLLNFVAEKSTAHLNETFPARQNPYLKKLINCQQFFIDKIISNYHAVYCQQFLVINLQNRLLTKSNYV
jgi:hypothetical protein